MTALKRRYFETRPGLDTVRYVLSYGFVTLLAKGARNRPHRFFTELSSNIDRHILTEGLFEKGVIDLLRDLVRKLQMTDLMIDIGANIGNHTVSLGDLFSRVEAVEPHPTLFRILETNVMINGMGNVVCHNFGLADEDATATLQEPADNHALARVKERSLLPPETFGLSEAQFGNSYTIELRSALDFVGRFADRLDRSFIKIDVEGMEQEIIGAFLPLLHDHKPLIAFEWITTAQPELTQMLLDLPGYELWGIRSNDLGRNRIWRAMKLVATGRSFTLERIDTRRLDSFYPLALLVPAQTLSEATFA